MRDIIKTVMVLALIALISGALLGIVNSFTQVDSEEQLRNKLALVYNEPSKLTRLELNNSPGLNPTLDKEITGYGAVLDVFIANDGTYVMRSLGKGGYGGDIELLIAIKDNKIMSIAPFKHAETPGLGTKGFDESYLAAFYNKDITDIDKFSIVKSNASNDSEIRTISGATYTSNAIANAVNIAAYWYNINGPYAEDSEE